MKGVKLQLRLISAWDALQAQQEALGLGGDALSRNGCVLAKALYRGRKRVFPDGKTLLQAMPAQTVACWMGEYDRLCRLDVAAWEADTAALEQDTWGRLRWKALRALGLLPKNMTEGQLLTCVKHMVLDGREQLQRLCPQCQGKLQADACPVCGAPAMTVNPKFDMKRFEEMKRNGSPAMDHAAAGQAGISPAEDPCHDREEPGRA